MGKKVIATIIIVGVLLLLATTNPGKDKYVAWAKEQLMQQSSGLIEKGVVSLLGNPVLDSSTSMSNFVFFTLYITEFDDRKAVTVGILQNFVPVRVTAKSQTAVVNPVPIPKVQPTNEPVPKQETAAKKEAYSPSPVALVPFKAEDVDLQIPEGWERTELGGYGDWVGWKFTNPQDINQQVIITRSYCVGCVMEQKAFSQGIQNPDPTAAIPTAAMDRFVFNNGLSAGYSYVDSKNPYTAHGELTISYGENRFGGYGQVEVFLPDSQKPLASQILNSFQL